MIKNNAEKLKDPRVPAPRTLGINDPPQSPRDKTSHTGLGDHSGLRLLVARKWVQNPDKPPFKCQGRKGVVRQAGCQKLNL